MTTPTVVCVCVVGGLFGDLRVGGALRADNPSRLLDVEKRVESCAKVWELGARQYLHYGRLVLNDGLIERAGRYLKEVEDLRRRRVLL